MRVSKLAGLALAVIFTMAGANAAFASSEAQAISPLSLRLGPGVNYKIVSDIAQGVQVDVERCQRRWCLIDRNGHRGWASMDQLTFGVEPRGPFTGPKFKRVSGGSGTICFHTGPNFSGQSVCSKTGMVVPDLALYGYDNVFASISVEGSISAHVCSEFNFGAYCETINEDQPSLSRHLKRAVSSYRVW